MQHIARVDVVQRPVHGGQPIRVAGIDVGSNGIRLLVADISPDGELEPVKQSRFAVRLGRYAYQHGILDEQEVLAAIEALRECKQLIVKLEVNQVRAVATSAVREAINGQSFRERVLRECGIDLDIIDGAEEARLVHRAVKSRLEPLRDPTQEPLGLLMDLGGGSLELALANQAHIHWSESRPIGTVRMLERYGRLDQKTFIAKIKEELRSFQLLHTVEPARIGLVIATGGNIGALAKLIQGVEPRKDGTTIVQTAALDEAWETLSQMTSQERMARFEFKEDRADVILPATAIYLEVLHRVGATEVHVPGWGLREGLVLDLGDAYYDPDKRTHELEHLAEQSAFDLGSTFGFDAEHARRVAHHALRLFDHTESLHQLGPAEKRMLQVASILHDVGKAIQTKGHHKHSKYLIENAQFIGLDTRQVRMAALVARYHREATPKPKHTDFAQCSANDQRTICQLGSLLRMADAIEAPPRGRVRRLDLELGATQARLLIQGTDLTPSLQRHIQSRSDLFQATFQRTLKVQYVA